MRSVVRFLPGVAAAAIVLGVAGSASALPLLTLSGSARLLYGASAGSPAVTPYGVGFGLRAGVTLPASLYLGASFDYFFGESKDEAVDILSSGGKLSTSTTQVLGNVGYDLGFGPLTLRPSLGLGVSDSSLKLAGTSNSDARFVASPGAELIVGLGLLTASAEARYNKVFSDAGSDGDAVVLGIGLGISL
jgi:hypothetical protein